MLPREADSHRRSEQMVPAACSRACWEEKEEGEQQAGKLPPIIIGLKRPLLAPSLASSALGGVNCYKDMPIETE